jgi:hypothetical protein
LTSIGGDSHEQARDREKSPVWSGEDARCECYLGKGLLVQTHRWQVIEQRSGAENHEMKERITAQLEAAANRIRDLENQLERLKGGELLLRA